MKKLLTLVLAFVVVLGVCNTTLAYDELFENAEEGMVISPNPNAKEESTDMVDEEFFKDLNLFVDGELVGDEKIFLQDSRTYIPLRKVSEALGYDVDYKEETKDITISNEETTVKMNLESKSYTVNDKELEMDVFPILEDDVTVVPVRFVAEAFGLDVEWDERSFTVMIGNYELKGEKEGQVRDYENVNLKMYLPENFDEIIDTEESEDSDGYQFWTKREELLGSISRSQEPSSRFLPGYIVDYSDGYYTEVIFPSDVQFSEETMDDYKATQEVLLKVFDTMELY